MVNSDALGKAPRVVRDMLNCLKPGSSGGSDSFIESNLSLAGAWTNEPGKLGNDGLIWNQTKDIGLLFLGEIFQSSNGIGEASLPDGCAKARWMIQEYEKEGLSFLGKLNGWFAGFLIDLREQTSVLFNDRYGLGRIYYHQAPEAFYFSSQAKSLLKVLPQTRRLDERGVAEWLSCGCVLQNRTLFSNVSLLPPGSAWIFSADGRMKKTRYFDPAIWESQSPLSPAEYYECLKETFPRILKRYMNGDRTVGMSLTGGLDGRMIMAWSPHGPGQLPCYTFNGPIRDCADVKIARKVAGACGQAYQTIPIQSQFFTEFTTLAEETVYLTDGAMDVTGAVELYVNRLASQIAPVRLTGNYGSEILRSNVAFKSRRLPGELFSPELLRRVSDAAGTYSEEAAGNRLSFIAFKQVPWHHFARFAVEQSQIAIRSPFLDNDLVALAFRASPVCASSLEHSLRLIAEGNPQLGCIPTDRGITYPAGKTFNRINRSLQEFLAKAEYAYDYGMPDWLARVDSCLAPLQLERLFLGRQKFCHFRSWYRHQLSGFVKQVLLDPRSRSRGYLNGSALEPMVAAHVQGSRNFTLEIHKLISLELLQRLLLS